MSNDNWSLSVSEYNADAFDEFTNKPKFKIAIYCRVSKEEQNPENQELELREYAKNRGFPIFKVYTDKISGSSDSRPALNNLMMDARKKCFDAN